MRRSFVKKSSDRKQFGKSIKKVAKVNVAMPMRGGYRI
ncbi:MAG: hypothetical protein [Arizlama microvirus]|nr:MAG: hypothetical protein [Arizlama microvirus]